MSFNDIGHHTCMLYIKTGRANIHTHKKVNLNLKIAKKIIKVRLQLFYLLDN